MAVTANLPEAYRLFHRGAVALSKVEMAGFRMDVPYLQTQSKVLGDSVKDLNRELLASSLGKHWSKYCLAKGEAINTESNPQLGAVLFDVMGLKPSKRTAPSKDHPDGQAATDQESIDKLVPEVPELSLLLKLRKVRKSKGTYIDALLREVNSDGYLRPFFSLSTTQTYRSSSEDPNAQNMPVRDPEQGQVVRRAFRPRKGHRLVERDYSGIEVCVAACYNQDPNLIAYILDKTKDMHRDMAMQCFKLPLGNMTKPIRQIGKSDFVFPQFYGDYYVACARNMWNDAADVKTKEGVPLRDHLKSVGIRGPDSFERHIKSVEQDFWGVRFREYDRWRIRVWEEYQRTGHIDMFTGFRCGGVLTRNELINRPIQGSAFHCLLWSLIEIQALSERKRWQSPIVGQIHDSIIQDVAEDESEQVHRSSVRIMTQEIRKEWPWITVPLTVESKRSEVDGNWYEMEEYS